MDEAGTVYGYAVAVDPRGRLRYGHVDGRTAEFHPLWLRERAPDPATTDPQTGQRLIEAADIPLDLAVTDACVENDGVRLSFSDGHSTVFSFAVLDEAISGRAEERRLWGRDLTPLPQADAQAVVTDDAALHAMLEALDRYGCVIVRGLAATEDGMSPVVDRIGPLRRTNWGGIADVKAIPSAYDLTMTARHLEKHADNPYRDPIPGYIFLHCIVNNAEGGDSEIADGFAVAERMRREHPEEFSILTTVRPRFRYVDETTHLEHEGPLIELGSSGEVFRVRYSNRTETVDALEPDVLDPYYRARARFHALINSPEMTVQFKLGPGDMIVMDNYRLLHGRRGYKLETGMRHLRQGYVDRDTLQSRRRILARSHKKAVS
ncbi:2-trimethylaminoethylphosphonate dioxygenase [Rhodospirillaceae bacterium SYSU D60014]|uniref:2-trimethylaminoethylphosphonate dioxygenase n=1 Tax=Virgifigura deserti TaxID=2268457 RepID=UPI000E66E51B